ncbi:hypothetical protein OAB57_01085 [Bacteriovoracaceae bacterium]|nr:hypothetical protein [Bacteriovoracaceae bacterium]
MKNLKTVNIFVLSLLSILTFEVNAQGKKRRGPPQEAIHACSDKQSNDTCSFIGRHGSLNGLCQTPKEDLVCVPKGHRKRKQQKPDGNQE